MLNQAADPFGIIGQVLDSQFRVDRLVGEGGFSAVYRGHHLGLDEPIAIKCLKLPPSLPSPIVDQFVKRFRDESRILYRLSQGNLNIVRSIACGTWQSPVGILVPFMVLEWMDGRSLANEFTIRRTVGKQGRPLEEVLKVFESAADGIAHAHAQGVIHRDLNPGNFFFTTTTQGQRLKVLDFGVAKILDDSTLNIERMQTVGQIRIFAPAYGSPEQFDDSLGKVGAPSDVYAFALILLEALRDRAVNDGTHLGEFAQRAIDPAHRPTPRSLGIAVPDEVESIFARATRLSPHERWQTMSEFWNALTNAVTAATQERYAQAATETPSLGMPQTASRSTKTGMAPPAQQGKPSMKRMDKTVPVGAVLPPVPGQAPRPPVPPSAPKVEAAPAAPPAPAPAALGFGGEEETRIGQAPQGVPNLLVESEGEEVTRVGAPAADVLAGLADGQLRPGHGVTMTKVSEGNPNAPRPAAGQSPDPQPQQGFPNPHAQQGRPPNMAGTLMMAPGTGFAPPPQAPLQAPPQAPLQAPPPGAPGHPMQVQPQMPTTPGIGPGGPPPGYPQPPGPPMGQAPQMPPQQPPMQQQMPPPQQPQPPPMQQQMPPPYQQAPQQPMPHAQAQAPYGASPSLPPEGVPKKGNGLLFALIGVGVLVLVGVGVAVAVVATGGPKTPQVTSASMTAVTPPPPAPTPEPVETVATPTPAEPEADAGSAAAVDGVDASVAVAANDPSPDNGGQPAAPAPAPAPQPGPAAQPGPAPQPWQPAAPTQPVKSAAPVDPDAFNEGSARSSLAGANLAFCKKEGGVSGPGSATVTFNPEGTVSAVTVDAPYAGTPTGDCVKGLLQRVKTKSWKGSPQSVKTTFDIPK